MVCKVCQCQVYDLSVFRHLELFGKEQAGLKIKKTESNDTGDINMKMHWKYFISGNFFIKRV